jgi:hypothetical protein
MKILFPLRYQSLLIIVMTGAAIAKALVPGLLKGLY